jgi:hypothetical protein
MLKCIYDLLYCSGGSRGTHCPGGVHQYHRLQEGPLDHSIKLEFPLRLFNQGRLTPSPNLGNTTSLECL